MDRLYDREMDELDRQLAEGIISQLEYNIAERELRKSFQAYAEEVADNARRSVLGEW